jgi:hypothetical protein
MMVVVPRLQFIVDGNIGTTDGRARSPKTLSDVIASEAKQSIVKRKERMDCFVASALAMTSRLRV